MIAYTIRPVVTAGLDRLVVRNPLRTLVVPWASVQGLRAAYSAELTAEDKTYQLWAVPVSLRQRKKASRRIEGGDLRPRTFQIGGAGQFGFRGANAVPGAPDQNRAWSDQVVDLLRELAQTNAVRPTAKGEVEVTWCWWVIAPTLVGLVALVALILA